MVGDYIKTDTVSSFLMIIQPTDNQIFSTYSFIQTLTESLPINDIGLSTVC